MKLQSANLNRLLNKSYFKDTIDKEKNFAN